MARTRNGISKKRKLMKITDEKINEIRSGWEDLNYNLLQQIFRLLPIKDLICSISLVCRHWKTACVAALFWTDDETLDLTPMIHILGTRPTKNNTDFDFHYYRMHQALSFVLNWDTTEHGQRCIRNIIFAPRMYVKDDHLAFVAQRSAMLKKLTLFGSYDISIMGLSRIIQNWRELEDLSIGPLQHDGSDRFFRAIGSSCKNLTKLHIFGSFAMESKLSKRYFKLDENNASIIAENLLKLKILNLDEANLHKYGVWTLLSESKSLIELNLKRCQGRVNPPISAIITTRTLVYLKNDVCAKITRCVSDVKNCVKYWSITSSPDPASKQENYTTDELVNQLWTGDILEYEIARYVKQRGGRIVYHNLVY